MQLKELLVNNKIKQKYKDLLIELVDGDDWLGARNLIDLIIGTATPEAPTPAPAQEPAQVEQVPPAPPQPTDFDNERAARMAAKNR